MDAVEAANSAAIPACRWAWPTSATVLWTEYLKHDPADPNWPDRDRFVLSAGHGSMLIYSLLHLTGYARPTIDDIKGFRQLGSPCAGHPENFLLDGVEATTGPLGQGVAMAVGMAIAERHLNAEYRRRSGRSPHLGDRRRRLPDGGRQPRGGGAGRPSRPRPADRLLGRQPDHHRRRDRSFDLARISRRATPPMAGTSSRCDGHDVADVRRAIDEALADPRPSLIACRTIIGKGAPNKQGTAATHGAALGADEVAAAREELGWDYPPFEIPGRDRSPPGARLGGAAQSAHADWQRAPRRQRTGRASSAAAWPAICPESFSLADYIQGLIDDAAEGRDPQGVGDGAGRDQRPAARDDRRLGRPHRFEQHQNERPEPADERTIIPAAISITASASSAWPRR